MAERKFSIHDADCAWDVESIRKEEAGLTSEREK
jgi:hypothetical protein